MQPQARRLLFHVCHVVATSGLLFLNHQRLLVEINSVFVLTLSLVKHSSCSLSGDLPGFFHQSIVRLWEIYKNRAEHIGLDLNKRLLWHHSTSLPHCLLSPKRNKENTTFSCSFLCVCKKHPARWAVFYWDWFFWQSYVCWKQQNVHGNSAMAINLFVLHVSCPSLLNFVKQMKNHSG